MNEEFDSDRQNLNIMIGLKDAIVMLKERVEKHDMEISELVKVLTDMTNNLEALSNSCAGSIKSIGDSIKIITSSIKSIHERVLILENKKEDSNQQLFGVAKPKTFN